MSGLYIEILCPNEKADAHLVLKTPPRQTYPIQEPYHYGC